MTWHYRIRSACLVVLAFTLGLILLFFPWLRHWESNSLPAHASALAAIWRSYYFRGALSGLGLLNIYVALGEFAHQISDFFKEK